MDGAEGGHAVSAFFEPALMKLRRHTQQASDVVGRPARGMMGRA